MEIAKTKECLSGKDGFYIDRSKSVNVDGVKLFGIGYVDTSDIKKTNLFKGGAKHDSGGEN